MPNEATLTSKDQITIHGEIRNSLSMKPGDRMTFSLIPDSSVVMRVERKSIASLVGILHKKGSKSVPIEQFSR